MPSERDLSLKITADATQAKEALAEVQEAQQGVVTGTNQATAATTASTGAMRDQGAAAAQSSEQVSESSDTLSDLGNAASVTQVAQQRLAGTSKDVAAAAVTQATAVRSSAAAAGADAVAETAQAAATRASAVAAEADAVAETGQAAATSFSTSAAMANAIAQTSEAAATGLAGEAAAGYAPKAGLMGLAARAAGAAVAGKEIAVARLATGLIKLAAPVLGVVTVIALLPQVIKLVVEKTTEWSTKIGESIVGLDEQAGIARKAGESTQDYQKRVNEAADSNEDLTRALVASSKGIIGVTADSTKLRAEWILHEEAMHKGSQSADRLAFAYKELGLKMSESLKFEDAKLSVSNFVSAFDSHLKEGENSARRFASVNKDNVEAWMELYEDAGDAIPPDLQKIADKYDIVTQKQKESLKLAQDQLAAWESLTPKARALVEQSEEMLASHIRWGEAFITPTVHIEELLKGIKKIGTEGVPSLAGAAKEIQAALKDVTSAAADADAALARLYESEPLAPGDIQPGLAPGDWIG